MNILPWISIPVGDTLDTLDEIMDEDEKGQVEFQAKIRELIIDLICEQFLFKEDDFFPTIDLVRKLSPYSAIFQLNVLKKRRQNEETFQYPNRALLFTLNLYPESQCLYLTRIHECKNLLNFVLLGARKFIQESYDQTEEKDLMPLDFDLRDLIRIISYDIFHNIYVYPETKKAIVQFGHSGYFYMDCEGPKQPTFPKIFVEKNCVLLTMIKQDGMVWFQNPES